LDGVPLIWHIDEEVRVHVIAEGRDGRFEELTHHCVVEAGSDVARIHLLAGNPRSALALLSLVTRGRRRLTPRVRDLIAACVAHDRALWVRALALSLARGSIVDRIRAATTVVRVRLGLPVRQGL
jgi:hypothetical protein